ncbi:MAG: VirB3 family type IV secretion system protein [Pseudomonadota bacterium]
MADPLFRALARPQMVAGVTYPLFVLNAIVATELFLLFKSPLALIPALFIHAAGYAAHLRDPHIMALWLTRLRKVPRVKNYSMRGANVYAP